MKISCLIIMFLLPVTLLSAQSASFDNPRIGIVISKSSINQDWEIVQMSAHGWGATVNLAGIPYDCLFIEDVVEEKDLSRYGALIFTQCASVKSSLYDGLEKRLSSYLENAGNLIIDGPLAVYDESGQPRNHRDLDKMLGVKYPGYMGDANYRLKTTGNDHYVTRIFEENQFITQHLAGGINVVSFAEKGTDLLSHSNERQSNPYLSVKTDAANRFVLVSEFGTWASAPSFFRNAQPQVFYANELFNVLIRAIHWTVYGDPGVPFPVPQVSNANTSVIIRHDGDGSDIPDAQITTLNYITDIARESGVVSVYSWVSSGAAESGWEKLAPLGKKLEQFGGEIGTHSKFHNIDQKMTPERWAVELDSSVHEIESNMAAQGYPIGDVAWFINPGNTIRMSDYGEVARRFSFYMTHGFEQDVPFGWGNLTWFTGENRNFVLLENIPSPDYQWFYDPEWSYTTQQITAYEEAIFDHLYHGIGRGAIFNEMWHDYSITTQPQREKERIVNESNIAFYDAMKTKFATHEIYCPTPEDLGHKLRAMAQWDYQWKSQFGKMEIQLDLGNVLMEEVADFTGGMGLKIENSSDYIRSVKINGVAHFAFGKDLVILPNLLKGKNDITVIFDKQPPQMPHLQFVSKRMPAIRQTESGLEVDLLTKSKAKFRFKAHEPFVLLNADWQQWNRNYDYMLNGYVTTDRTIKLHRLQQPGFWITRCTLPIAGFEESATLLTLRLSNGSDNNRIIEFRSDRAPKNATVRGAAIAVVKLGNVYRLILPEFADSAELQISF